MFKPFRELLILRIAETLKYVVITHIFYARQSQRESKTSATDFTNFHGLGFKNPRTLVKFAAKCF